MPAAVRLPFEARAEGWAVHFSDVAIVPGTATHCGPIVLEPGVAGAGAPGAARR